MQAKNLNIAFFTTIAVSIVVFIYLVFIGYDEIQTAKDVIKIIASILFPLPMLFFVRFLLIEHFIPQNTDDYKLKNQRPATFLLIGSVVLGIVMMQGVEIITQHKLEDHLIFAHLVNSTTLSSYVLNFLLYNNLKVNGILSGVLLALAINIFFL